MNRPRQLCYSLTCSEVNDNVQEKDSVWDAVEDNPVRAEVIIEERNGDWEDDQVGY